MTPSPQPFPAFYVPPSRFIRVARRYQAGHLGRLSGIPKEVLGFTVLAWGNAVRDLSKQAGKALRLQ